MRIKVTVDSTNDLSRELMEKYDISAVPLTINKGGKAYKDMVDITPKDIYAFVKTGGDLPKTSAVNVREYQEIFNGFIKEYDAIIHINISSDMSACYQNAVIAAEGLNVFPIDSKNLSTGSGLLAIKAAEMANEGVDAQEIARYLADMTDRVDASFLVSRLDYLRKGGRCSAVAALGANLLKLKPCIEVRSGKMGVGKKYRGQFARCLEQYVRDRLEGSGDIDQKRIFITHSGVDLDTVEAVRAAIEKVMDFEEILVTVAGCTISSHCGDGTLGILYVHKEQ